MEHKVAKVKNRQRFTAGVFYERLLCLADCVSNWYGYRCKKECDCTENGDCDPVKGCVCSAGYTGHHCESGTIIHTLPYL